MGCPVVGPDQLVDVGLAVGRQIVADGEDGHLVHYVKAPGEAENVDGKKEQPQPEGVGVAARFRESARR